MKILIPIAIYVVAALLLTMWSKKRHQYDSDLDPHEDIEEQHGEVEDEENSDNESDDQSNKKELTEEKGSTDRNEEGSSETVQIAMAKTKNFEVQKQLLNSTDLCAAALVTICENPANFNFESDNVESWFVKAINRTKLTPRQEIRISQNGKEFVMKKALILKDDLSPTGLIELCRNPGSMNLDSDTVRKWYLNALNRVKTSQKQQLKMVETGNFAILRALLLSDRTKAEALTAVAESPGSMNTDNETVWDWFERAVKRTELTADQQVRMVNAKNFASKRAILLNPNLEYEALLALCNNTKYFNMRNDTVQRYFKNATKRLLPKLTDEQKVELTKTNVEVVVMALM